MTCDIFEAMPLKGLPDFRLQCCHIDMFLRFLFLYESILFWYTSIFIDLKLMEDILETMQLAGQPDFS